MLFGVMPRGVTLLRRTLHLYLEQSLHSETALPAISTLTVTLTLAAPHGDRLGTVPVAAHQVVYQLWIFASFVVDSLAIAGQTLIAVALGAGRPREAREIADRLLEARPHRVTLGVSIRCLQVFD